MPNEAWSELFCAECGLCAWTAGKSIVPERYYGCFKPIHIGTGETFANTGRVLSTECVIDSDTETIMLGANQVVDTAYNSTCVFDYYSFAGDGVTIVIRRIIAIP
jgi:hypothetical protein